MSIDASITLWFNGMGQPWLDPIVMALTRPTTWTPLYAILIFLIWKRLGWRHTLIILVGTGICVVIADQFASGICKPLFHRLRPTHEPTLEGIVRVVNNYRSGLYGFFSSHAANTCAIALYLSFVLRSRAVTALLFAYAAINCWTRLYLGVHYFGDILVGIIWGCLTGFAVLRLYKWVLAKSGKLSLDN